MDTERKRIKILIAKTSLDGHWRGVVVVTTALRDAGMEVVYGGMLNAQQIVETAIQEDVDVIGLNIGGSYSQARAVMQLLGQRGVEDVLVVAGGTVPRDEIPQLKEMGIGEVFPTESRLDSIVDYIRKNTKRAP